LPRVALRWFVFCTVPPHTALRVSAVYFLLPLPAVYFLFRFTGLRVQISLAVAHAGSPFARFLFTRFIGCLRLRAFGFTGCVNVRAVCYAFSRFTGCGGCAFLRLFSLRCYRTFAGPLITRRAPLTLLGCYALPHCVQDSYFPYRFMPPAYTVYRWFSHTLRCGSSRCTAPLHGYTPPPDYAPVATAIFYGSFATFYRSRGSRFAALRTGIFFTFLRLRFAAVHGCVACAMVPAFVYFTRFAITRAVFTHGSLRGFLLRASSCLRVCGYAHALYLHFLSAFAHTAQRGLRLRRFFSRFLRARSPAQLRGTVARAPLPRMDTCVFAGSFAMIRVCYFCFWVQQLRALHAHTNALLPVHTGSHCGS